MSECVVRMEMPKSCDMCPCLDDYGDYPRCRISNEQRGYNFPIHEKRMPNCPIICQLPEGHGRLVDADAFISTIRPLCEEDKFAACTLETVKQLMVEHINNAPTIVPPERSET